MKVTVEALDNMIDSYLTNGREGLVVWVEKNSSVLPKHIDALEWANAVSNVLNQVGIYYPGDAPDPEKAMAEIKEYVDALFEVFSDPDMANYDVADTARVVLANNNFEKVIEDMELAEKTEPSVGSVISVTYANLGREGLDTLVCYLSDTANATEEYIKTRIDGWVKNIEDNGIIKFRENNTLAPIYLQDEADLLKSTGPKIWKRDDLVTILVEYYIEREGFIITDNGLMPRDYKKHGLHKELSQFDDLLTNVYKTYGRKGIVELAYYLPVEDDGRAHSHQKMCILVDEAQRSLTEAGYIAGSEDLGDGDKVKEALERLIKAYGLIIDDNDKLVMTSSVFWDQPIFSNMVTLKKLYQDRKLDTYKETTITNNQSQSISDLIDTMDEMQSDSDDVIDALDMLTEAIEMIPENEDDGVSEFHAKVRSWADEIDKLFDPLRSGQYQVRRKPSWKSEEGDKKLYVVDFYEELQFVEGAIWRQIEHHMEKDYDEKSVKEFTDACVESMIVKIMSDYADSVIMLEKEFKPKRDLPRILDINVKDIANYTEAAMRANFNLEDTQRMLTTSLVKIISRHMAGLLDFMSSRLITEYLDIDVEVINLRVVFSGDKLHATYQLQDE